MAAIVTASETVGAAVEYVMAIVEDAAIGVTVVAAAVISTSLAVLQCLI
jgi:hypothetical protein